MKLLFDENLSPKLAEIFASQFPSILYGHPPKLIWLRIGNCTRAEVVSLIDKSQQEINRFIADPIESVLVLI